MSRKVDKDVSQKLKRMDEQLKLASEAKVIAQQTRTNLQMRFDMLESESCRISARNRPPAVTTDLTGTFLRVVRFCSGAGREGVHAVGADGWRTTGKYTINPHHNLISQGSL